MDYHVNCSNYIFILFVFNLYVVIKCLNKFACSSFTYYMLITLRYNKFIKIKSKDKITFWGGGLVLLKYNQKLTF